MANNEVEVSWDKPVKVKGKNQWTVRVTVCNLTNQDIKILVADNPWKGAADPKRPYAEKLYTGDKDPITGKPTRETTIKKAKENGKTLTVKAKGNKDECRTIVFTYPWYPLAAYTDVFILQPDGTVPDKPAEGGAVAHMFPEQQVGMVLPESPKPTYVCVVPMPYPASLESVWDGPVEIMIDEVEGLPEEVELVGTFPKMDELYKLDLGDRESEAAIVIRQLAFLEPDIIHTVTVHQKAMSPRKASEWPTRLVSFDIVAVEYPLPDEEPCDIDKV